MSKNINSPFVRNAKEEDLRYWVKEIGEFHRIWGIKADNNALYVLEYGDSVLSPSFICRDRLPKSSKIETILNRLANCQQMLYRRVRLKNTGISYHLCDKDNGTCELKVAIENYEEGISMFVIHVLPYDSLRGESNEIRLLHDLPEDVYGELFNETHFFSSSKALKGISLNIARCLFELIPYYRVGSSLDIQNAHVFFNTNTTFAGYGPSQDSYLLDDGYRSDKADVVLTMKL